MVFGCNHLPITDTAHVTGIYLHEVLFVGNVGIYFVEEVICPETMLKCAETQRPISVLLECGPCGITLWPCRGTVGVIEHQVPNGAD